MGIIIRQHLCYRELGSIQQSGEQSSIGANVKRERMPFWKLYYHAIWGTRDRAPLIDTRVEGRVHKIVHAAAYRAGLTVHAIGGTDDHVHLVIEAPPTLKLSEAIGKTKGASSHAINRQIMVGTEARFGWQAEYGVLSFAEADLDAVCRYVLNQRRLHATDILRPVLELGTEDR